GPNPPPVTQSGPRTTGSYSGVSSTSSPLTGRSSTLAIVQFQPRCTAVANHRLRVRRYATESRTPARKMLTSANALAPGFPTCARANAALNATVATTGPNASTSTWNG